MQEQQKSETSEAILEVVEEDIWGSLVDFWNLILFKYEVSGTPIEITVGLILLVVIAFIVTSVVLRLIRSFITSKLAKGDKQKFISVFKFIKYFVYLVVILITLSSA